MFHSVFVFISLAGQSKIFQNYTYNINGFFVCFFTIF